MTIYWAKSTGGFYHSGVHAVIPPDAVEISETKYQQLRDGQSDILRIDLDLNGIPTLVEKPVVVADLTCSPWQIREALNQLGWRNSVENVISQGDTTLKDLWEFAPSFKRDHPKILEIATSAGKTEADIDAVFTLAVTLNP
jgi:hypothetical protein